MTLIRDFVEGAEFTGFYLLKSAEVKQTNATPSKEYFDLVLADSSGEIATKYWDISLTEKETFFPMMIVKAQVQAHTYRDKLQAKIIRIRKVTDEDGVKLTDFIRSAPISADNLISTLKQTISTITDDTIRRIVEFCVFKVEDKLSHYPAAKTHHHNYFAGLAYHVVWMLELGEFIAKQRPFLNHDLMKAGIILHDIAKPEEMIAELGIVSHYSTVGKLIGHINLATNWINEAALAFGLDPIEPKVVALQHLVLSHHNLGEWGSPVQPQLPEAVALHYIDAIDAKLQAVEDALSQTAATEEWTQPIRSLENKAIHRLKW